jgi:hypothetical protein
MGRGLSELQGWILRVAAVGPLQRKEICLHYFGWEPTIALANPNRIPTWWHGSKIFDPDRIGRAEYNRVMATISRACRRLEARGLITQAAGAFSNWHRVEITDAGRAYLSVKSFTDRVST